LTPLENTLRMGGTLELSGTLTLDAAHLQIVRTDVKTPFPDRAITR